MMLLKALHLQLLEPGERLDALLFEGAEFFVRAGGTVTLADWEAMTPHERSALIAAHRAVKIEDMLRLTAMMGTTEDRMRALADVDGGASYRQFLAERAAAKIAQDSEGKP